jgi:glycine hydroxymethyltransferase
VLNCNAVPFDPRKPWDPSGVRIGTAAITSRGMGKDEMLALADWIDEVVKAPEDEAVSSRVAVAVRELCARFPAPGIVSSK